MLCYGLDAFVLVIYLRNQAFYVLISFYVSFLVHIKAYIVYGYYLHQQLLHTLNSSCLVISYSYLACDCNCTVVSLLLKYELHFRT